MAQTMWKKSDSEMIPWVVTVKRKREIDSERTPSLAMVMAMKSVGLHQKALCWC